MKITLLDNNWRKTTTLIVVVLGVLLIMLLLISIFKENKSDDDFSEYSGFFIKTDSDYFLVADKDSLMFTKNEVVKLSPSSDSDLFKGLNSGDRIIIKILTVGDLNPRLTDVYQLRLTKKGDLSNLEEDTVKYIESLGYIIK